MRGFLWSEFPAFRRRRVWWCGEFVRFCNMCGKWFDAVQVLWVLTDWFFNFGIIELKNVVDLQSCCWKWVQFAKYFISDAKLRFWLRIAFEYKLIISDLFDIDVLCYIILTFTRKVKSHNRISLWIILIYTNIYQSFN